MDLKDIYVHLEMERQLYNFIKFIMLCALIMYVLNEEN